MVRNPQYFSKVTVRTWPHSLSRFSFLRDFEMRDEEGGLLVVASQEWVLMDVETRKFASVKDFYTGPMDFCEDRVFEKKARKAPSFDEGNRPDYVIVPGYSSIDLNGHVNNAIYAGFVIDALNPGPEGDLKTMQIDYRHEVLPDRSLTVHTLVEEGRSLSKGVNEDSVVAFGAVMEFVVKGDNPL